MAAADYSIGFLDVREVSDAVRAYVTLRTALMKARFDHNVAMAALSKATGTLDGDSDLFYLRRPPANGGAATTRTTTQRSRGPSAIAVLVARRALARRPSAAAAGATRRPEAVIRKTVDDAFAVLKDKSLASARSATQRIAALREIADRVFDWAEMARSSLGAQWRSLDARRAHPLRRGVQGRPGREYIDDIDRFQGTEKVTVDGSTREGEDVVVQTTLVTASRDHVPIDYRMRSDKAGWKVVDISIEGSAWSTTSARPSRARSPT